MAPLASETSHSEVNNDTSTPMENYGATDDHEQSSLISGLTIEEEETQSLTAGATTVASSLISNASSASHYFQPQQQESRKQPSHAPSDSLDYSTTSSTNSIPPPNHTEPVSKHSYLGSIVRSLGHQQAFPSSMFPGQKLISPINSRETIQVQDSSFGSNNDRTNPSPSRTYPSYYYFPRSRDSTSIASSTSNSPYQNAGVGSNVYQKRRKPGFCPDDDFAFNNIDDGSRLASWRKCWRCFFSPRVLLTLLVCGVIVFNLLRLGTQQHQHISSKGATNSIRGKATDSSTQSTLNSSKSASDIDAEYVKLELIGGGRSKDLRSGTLDLSLFSDTDHP